MMMMMTKERNSQMCIYQTLQSDGDYDKATKSKLWLGSPGHWSNHASVHSYTGIFNAEAKGDCGSVFDPGSCCDGHCDSYRVRALLQPDWFLLGNFFHGVPSAQISAAGTTLESRFACTVRLRT